MSASVSIREATAGDAPAMHRMLVELARDTGKIELVTSTPEDIRHYGFGAQPAFTALIAQCDGGSVGLALFFDEFSSWRGRKGVHLLDLYVAPEMRGAGVGRRLIEAVVSRSATAGAAFLRLGVDVDNAEAVKFYERLGFIEYTDDRLFVLRGDAFASMIKA